MAIMKTTEPSRIILSDISALLENPSLHGRLVIEKRSAKTGKLKQLIEIDNLVCNTGKNAVAARLNGETVTTSGIINYMAVGTGTNIPAASISW